jgi:hypothetical protein
MRQGPLFAAKFIVARSHNLIKIVGPSSDATRKNYLESVKSKTYLRKFRRVGHPLTPVHGNNGPPIGGKFDLAMKCPVQELTWTTHAPRAHSFTISDYVYLGKCHDRSDVHTTVTFTVSISPSRFQGTIHNSGPTAIPTRTNHGTSGPRRLLALGRGF